MNRLVRSIELFGTLLYFTLSTGGTDSPSPCTATCQAIQNNFTINAVPASSYITMTSTSTLLHDVGHTAITPTTTRLNAENRRISSTVAHHEVTSNTPPQAILTTLEVSQVVSDKLISSIIHQGLTVQHNNPITSIHTPSLVLDGNDQSESTRGLNAGSVTAIPTSSVVLERGDMPASTSSVNVGTIIAGIAVAAAFILGLALISVILVAYRRQQNHPDATKGKHKILYLFCYV